MKNSPFSTQEMSKKLVAFMNDVDFTGTVASTRQGTLQDLIHTEFIENKQLNDVFNIVQNIYSKQGIPLCSGFGTDVGLAGTDANEFRPDSNTTLTLSDAIWDPAMYGDLFKFVPDQFNNSFAIWFAANGSLYGSADDALKQYFAEEINKTLLMIVYRVAFLGDKAATGLTAGKNPGLINGIDGIFKQAASSLYQVAIDKNDGLTYADQAFSIADIKAGYCTDILTSMVLAQSGTLRPMLPSEKVIVCTMSFLEAYRSERSRLGVATDPNVGTRPSYLDYYNDIPIIGIGSLDVAINSLFNSGTALKDPHRVLLTSKTNLMLGMQGSTPEESLVVEEIRTGYGQTNYTFSVKIDGKVPDLGLVVYAS